jgi:hypothetical protein
VAKEEGVVASLLISGGGGPVGGGADRDGESLRGGGSGRCKSDLTGGARSGPDRSAVLGPREPRLE